MEQNQFLLWTPYCQYQVIQCHGNVGHCIGDAAILEPASLNVLLLLIFLMFSQKCHLKVCWWFVGLWFMTSLLECLRIFSCCKHGMIACYQNLIGYKGGITIHCKLYCIVHPFKVDVDQVTHKNWFFNSVFIWLYVRWFTFDIPAHEVLNHLVFGEVHKYYVSITK